MMKRSIPAILLIAATAATGQTKAKPATTSTTPAKTTASTAGGVKLPPGVPPARGLVKTAFSLRYQDVKIGTGKDAQPNQIYKVLYTGWLAADGHKFDSSADHRPPVMGKDGKPELGPDGKPILGDPQPLPFMQGFGRVIPGFDQGFEGMKVGGKRRLFIPWQLAYGAHGRPGPDPAHPGIPPKADLIFDIELVDVMDMQMPPNRPGMMPMHPGAAIPPGHPPVNAAPNPASASPNPSTTAPANPATQPNAATRAQPSQPATPKPQQ